MYDITVKKEGFLAVVIVSLELNVPQVQICCNRDTIINHRAMDDDNLLYKKMRYDHPSAVSILSCWVLFRRFIVSQHLLIMYG